MHKTIIKFLSECNSKEVKTFNPFQRKKKQTVTVEVDDDVLFPFG